MNASVDTGPNDLVGENEHPWQPHVDTAIGRQLAKLLGLPRVEGDSYLSLLDRRTEDGLIVEEFHFESEPGELVSGMMVRSETAVGRLPTVLCLHDADQGRKTILGPKYYFDARLNWLRGWGRELARQGFTVAAITQRTFGKRPGSADEQAKIELLYGRTLMGAFVWEALRTLEILRDRDDVDLDRIGLFGFGLGGAVALYTAAVDSRVRALVTVCGGIGSLDTFVRWADPAVHGVPYFIPGILESMDHPEIIGSLAPRPYLLITRDGDPSMPMDGIRRAEWDGGGPYRDLAIDDRFRVTVRIGTHDLTMEDVAEGGEWMSRWLSVEAKRAFEIAGETGDED